MAETLVLLGGPAPDAPMAWVQVQAGEAVAHGMAAQRADMPTAPASRTVLILPGSEATVRRVSLEATTEAQARAALPHVFEGALASGDGGLHYAAGPVDDLSGQSLAIAMDANRMSRWLDRCAQFGADPRSVFLDFTVWPVDRGEVHIVETPRLAIVAAGSLGGFSIEPSLAPHVFSRWLRQNPEPISSIIVAGGGAEAWRARLPLPAPALRTAPALDPMLALAIAAAAPPDHAPNLRQGAFAPASDRKSSVRLWSFAALLAIAAVLLQVFSLSLAAVRDLSAAEQVRANAEREFRELHPEVRRIVNLRAQVTALGNASRLAGSHPVLAVTDPLIAVLDGAQGVRLEEIRHDPPGRIVRLKLSASDPAALTQAGDALRAQGIDVRSDSARQEADRFTVELGLEKQS